MSPVLTVFFSLGVLAVLGAGTAAFTRWSRQRHSPTLAIVLWLALSLGFAALWFIRVRAVQHAAGFDQQLMLGRRGFAAMASFLGICLGLSARLAWTLAEDPAAAIRPVLVRGARRALLGAGVCLAAVALLDLAGVIR